MVLLTTSFIQGVYTGKLLVKTTLLVIHKTANLFPGLVDQVCTDFLVTTWCTLPHVVTELSGHQSGLPCLHSAVCSSIAEGLAHWIFLYFFLFYYGSMFDQWRRGLSLQPIKVRVTKRHEWCFSVLYQVQTLYSTELAAGLLLHFFSESLCSYIIRACIIRTLIFATLGDFGWVGTCPYFLTTACISKLWDFALLPHSHVQILSQPVSGLHTKAVLLRVCYLTPVSCCCGFC